MYVCSALGANAMFCAPYCGTGCEALKSWFATVVT
jgi:hypothetical protein